MCYELQNNINIVFYKYQMSVYFPKLYGVDKNGKTKVWSASVVINTDGLPESIIEFGFLNGKQQTTSRVYTSGKNIGKKNETSPLEQAVSETQAKWVSKRDKESYSETLNIVNTAVIKATKEEDDITEKSTQQQSQQQPQKDQQKYFPMLAKVYEPAKTKTNSKSTFFQFPCYIQPKLDGVRCVSYRSNNSTHVLMQSRTGSYFESMPHISSMLEMSSSMQDGVILDGELYCHDMPFEELVGLVKKKKLTAEDREKVKLIEYHVYDIVDTNNTPYYIRKDQLKELVETIHLLEPNNKNILKYVETNYVNNIAEFKEYFEEKIQQGYEGIMLRTPNGSYRCNYRSSDLLKYKEFFENEYEIVGYKEGEGRDKGTIIWNCKTPEGLIFSVRPKGSIEYRKDLYENGDSYIGKPLTVIYQELSENGVPRFPVGKAVRNE